MLTKAVIAFLRYAAGHHSSSEIRPSEVRSIVIVELSRLGDVVSMLPAVSSIRSHFPKSKLYLFVQESYKPLLEGLNPGLEVIGVSNSDSAFGMIEIIKRARNLHSDLALSMSPSKRNAIVTLLSGTQAKAGYLTHTNTVTPYLQSTRVESYGMALKQHVSYSLRNIQERSLNVCRALGAEIPVHFPVHHVDPREAERVRASLKQEQIIPVESYLVIHPFSGWKFRTWAQVNFVDLVRRLSSHQGLRIVMLCEEKEKGLLMEMKSTLSGIESVRYFVSSNILHSAVLIQGAELFVGNDSGPLHLASALGVKTIGLFGPASPELTSPMAANGNYLYKRVECSPCEQRRCVRPERTCMDLITVDEVAGLVEQSLGKAPDQRFFAHA